MYFKYHLFTTLLTDNSHRGFKSWLEEFPSYSWYEFSLQAVHTKVIKYTNVYVCPMWSNFILCSNSLIRIYFKETAIIDLSYVIQLVSEMVPKKLHACIHFDYNQNGIFIQGQTNDFFRWTHICNADNSSCGSHIWYNFKIYKQGFLPARFFKDKQKHFKRNFVKIYNFFYQFENSKVKKVMSAVKANKFEWLIVVCSTTSCK